MSAQSRGTEQVPQQQADPSGESRGVRKAPFYFWYQALETLHANQAASPERRWQMQEEPGMLQRFMGFFFFFIDIIL